MQKTITYLGTDFSNSKGYADIARALAITNRKMYDQVNGKGVAQTYICEVELVGSTTAAQAVGIYTAPESWTVKNAVKRLHIARAESFKKAGIDVNSLPAYSRNLKMYLDKGHRACAGSDNNLRPALYTPTQDQTGSIAITTAVDSAWLYTRLAHTVGQEGGTLSQSFGDDYELTLMGDHHISNTGTLQGYNSVSVTQAYLEHRRNKTVNASASTGDVIQEEPNPLTLLMNDSISGQEKAEIGSQMQLVDPPYQTASGTWAGQDALDLHSASFLQTSTTYIRDRDVIRIPLGLAAVISANANPGAVRFHVIGMEDMQG